MRKEEPIRNYELIGECKGNPNGCFMDSCGHDCGCFTKEPKQEKINMNTHYVDFSNPNADKISSASTTSIKQESNFYEKLKFSFSEKLKQYFEDTPREKILEDWAKSAECDKVGPTVDDFLNNTKEKMYSEEEMINFAEFVATYADKNRNVNGEMLHAKSKYDGAERTIDLLEKWFEQFKKK
jgi:hypothetical protein